MMTSSREVLSTVGVLALMACGGPHVESAVRATPAPRSSVASLALAVPDEAIEGEPRCDDRVRRLFEGQGVNLSLVWGKPGQQTRRVTARFDEDGRPVSYSDTRGGLTNLRTLGEPVPGTLIALDWRTPVALVENQDSTGARSAVRVDFEEALVSETLGRPSEVMEKLWEMCSDTGRASGLVLWMHRADARQPGVVELRP